MSSVPSSAERLAGATGDAYGEFVDVAGERYYVIRNVEKMAPFFISVISSDDHWLFASSAGGLTAGRVSPETALFPYEPVDKLHDSGSHTGPKTIIRARDAGETRYWEPFNREHEHRYSLSRNLYKNTLGNRLCFEEINHDLDLAFRYTWSTSADFGFVRDCELRNLGTAPSEVDVLDGLQNVLPAGTPRFTQTNSSNLVNAYKWTELDEESGLVFLTLYSGITDRAEPCESLRATSVFCLGLDDPEFLISSEQVRTFRSGATISRETRKRGIRGAYFVTHSSVLAGGASSAWRLVIDAEQSQADLIALRQQLRNPQRLADAIDASVAAGSEALERIMASADALQETAEENVSVHHYANVLFNVLRGGIFEDGYNVSAGDLKKTIRHFNRPVYERNRKLFEELPARLRFDELFARTQASGDAQLQRLVLEYLPITFGRRHGDPSRPWNQFAIVLKDEHGEDLLSYQGNWRDIFQNWEALALSYPSFVENMIAKFVNASTADGYNPYRITKEGIDWEVEEPDDPWSYIGYWGDHQIIYLLKLLEWSRSFHPETLQGLLRQPLFSYANVPYRINALEQLLENPKATVVFDDAAAQLIERRVATMGADGKLLLDLDGAVRQVNLLEKLLVPLLAKLGNLVVDGGIWLNTQRPEWNDANNALVGQGLSMVTLCYMRRYLRFLQDLLKPESGSFDISAAVADWHAGTASALARLREAIAADAVDDATRYDSLIDLGRPASDFREELYARGAIGAAGQLEVDDIRRMLADALAVVDRSIMANKRDDYLYHAYNIAVFGEDSLKVEHLYAMLEGQVAALSSGAIPPTEAVEVLQALYSSSIYRPDQDSFMLYPDRDLPGFLDRNLVRSEQAMAVPLLRKMLAEDDTRVLLRDADGNIRFNADFANAADLRERLDELAEELGDLVAESRAAVLDLYEAVFNHRAFTGRSGTMFGFEGLGSIYWHMVSKLLLAAAENFFGAADSGADAETVRRLGELYYRIRNGIGFNKTPLEYGAFPTDPYSHTPKHAGARQPGMTGQVKEEVLTRFAELGIRVRNGEAVIEPRLLRRCEFSSDARAFRYLDIAKRWQTLDLPGASLAFTWCQVPFVYVLDDSGEASLEIEFENGESRQFPDNTIPADISMQLFERTGRIRRVTVTMSTNQLFAD